MHTNQIPNLDSAGLRHFGLTTATIFAALFGVLFPYFLQTGWPVWPWTVFGVLITWSLLAPSTLTPVYRGWMKVGLLLSRITTPIILTLVFLVAIVPPAIIMRVMRKDPMRRRLAKLDSSYRVSSTLPSVENMDKPY